MKLLLLTMLSLFSIPSLEWNVDFEKAKSEAKKEHKFILLNFSGSDWCGPCIQMHKQIFETAAFQDFAKKNLVLVNADFPRSKKHALSVLQQKKNDQLAEDYNKKGIFPLTLLLNSEGKVIESWEGLPLVSAYEFTMQLQTAMNGQK